MRSRLKAHFSLDQMSTTLEVLVETAMLLDYNGRDVVGSWCRHPKYAKKYAYAIPGDVRRTREVVTQRPG